MINPPGMIDVKVGQQLLMFLLPTPQEGVYAAMSAPWDEDQAVIVLDLEHGVRNLTSPRMIDLVRSLVDANGQIIPAGVSALRAKYEKELAAVPPKGSIVHLKWKNTTSNEGWQWDVPADSIDDSSDEETEPLGPVTR